MLSHTTREGHKFQSRAQNPSQPTGTGSCRQPLPAQKSSHGSIAKDCQRFVVADAHSLHHHGIAGGIQGAAEDRLIGKGMTNKRFACFNVSLEAVCGHVLGLDRDKIASLVDVKRWKPFVG